MGRPKKSQKKWLRADGTIHMGRKAEMVSLPLIAFTLTSKVPASRGVPEIWPVTRSIDRPAGSPEALNWTIGSGAPVVVRVSKNAVPTSPLSSRTVENWKSDVAFLPIEAEPSREAARRERERPDPVRCGELCVVRGAHAATGE
jgi:hypothetical protein